MRQRARSGRDLYASRPAASATPTMSCEPGSRRGALTASDGTLSSTSDLAITVNAASVQTVNPPPPPTQTPTTGNTFSVMAAALNCFDNKRQRETRPRTPCNGSKTVVSGPPTLRLAGWHYTQGVKALRVKAERLALIRLCREGGRVTSKDVEGNARPCKAVQGLGRHF